MHFRRGQIFFMFVLAIKILKERGLIFRRALVIKAKGILFIDDEEVLLEIGSQILEPLGYEVVNKKSSVQALELFRAEPDRFDVVVTDMTMPHDR